jgi:hypothetical protein
MRKSASLRQFGNPAQRSSRAFARLISLLLGAVLAAACGGSSDPFNLNPLWVVTDVVVTDLDGDGRSDVLTTARYVSDNSEGRLTVYRQTTPGHFTMESYVVGTYPWMIAARDVDGDGAPDVAIVDSGVGQPVQGQLWLLRQDPTQRGHLLPAQSLVTTRLASTVAIADLNGDGAPDLALDDNVQVQGGSGVTVLYQNKSARGTFAAPVIVPLPGQAGALAAGDVDGDARADLAVYTGTSPYGTPPPTLDVLSVLHQNADGTLASAVTFAPRSGLNSRRLVVRDADGDGHADVLQFLTPCCNPPASLTLVLQAPVGIFRDVATPLNGITADDAAFGDFDGDGRVDAAVVGSASARITLLRQTTSGGFVATGTVDLPASMSRITAGDVDGDGRTDLVVLGQDNQAWVLLQVAGQPGTFAAPRRLP